MRNYGKKKLDAEDFENSLPIHFLNGSSLLQQLA
jgi:hypothetical protein